jgi:hypothetical protein
LEVIAWLIADARAAGDSEVEAAELQIRHALLPASEVRTAARVLGDLGYADVATMMRRIVGKRKHDLRAAVVKWTARHRMNSKHVLRLKLRKQGQRVRSDRDQPN